MAYRTASRPSFWASRPFEWAVVVAVVLAAVTAVNHQYQELQGQAEYAAIQSVLGSMRTAMVLQYLQDAADKKTPSNAAAAVVSNPITLLQPLPVYAGIVRMGDQAQVQPGNWMFDADCGCIGYRPLNPDWLAPYQDFPSLWFKLRSTQGVPELVAMHSYFWRNAPIR